MPTVRYSYRVDCAQFGDWIQTFWKPASVVPSASGLLSRLTPSTEHCALCTVVGDRTPSLTWVGCRLLTPLPLLIALGSSIGNCPGAAGLGKQRVRSKQAEGIAANSRMGGPAAAGVGGSLPARERNAMHNLYAQIITFRPFEAGESLARQVGGTARPLLAFPLPHFRDFAAINISRVAVQARSPLRSRPELTAYNFLFSLKRLTHLYRSASPQVRANRSKQVVSIGADHTKAGRRLSLILF